MDTERLAVEIERLHGAWSSGDPTDRELRATCAARLEELRALYRDQPEAFGPELIGTLRSVAKGLAEAPRPLSAREPLESARSPLPVERTAFESPRPPPGGDSPHQALKRTFGYDSFRPGQEAIINAVLAGRDCIGVMPTGAGKSLTYQLPARLLPGTVLVVSPLIALMKDQVDALGEIGIRAAYLNSTLDPDERRRRVEAMRAGEYEIVYAAPEGIEASVGSALRGTRLSLVAVDEAHCISHWGHDFRPAYRNLVGLKKRFGVPLLALTATATRDVTLDIIEQLGMKDPAEYRGSFFRPNLHISTYPKQSGAGPSTRDMIVRLIEARAGESGIVYCLSRKSVDSLTEYLKKHGIRARGYHAGMDPDSRSRAQDAFRRDDTDVIVATVAFGMGIDKSNVRYVIHRDMPRSIEGYYQEIGRAGRDGVASDCVLFHSFADVLSYDRFTDESTPDVAERGRRQVREMLRWAESRACRHRGLIAHFGEKISPCGTSCDVCAGLDVVADALARPKTRAGRGAKKSGGASERAALDGSARVASRGEGATGAELGGGRESAVRGPLFDRLRALRKRLADARNVPAYVIFSDATLLAMADRRPSSEAEMLEVPGVGPKKLEQYGAVFLEALRDE